LCCRAHLAGIYPPELELVAVYFFLLTLGRLLAKAPPVRLSIRHPALHKKAACEPHTSKTFEIVSDWTPLCSTRSVFSMETCIVRRAKEVRSPFPPKLGVRGLERLFGETKDSLARTSWSFRTDFSRIVATPLRPAKEAVLSASLLSLKQGGNEELAFFRRPQFCFESSLPL
jgi:hypothetical protein